MFVRAIDLESWALLMPGGFEGRIVAAFGPRAAGVAVGVALVERLLLGALTCLVVGHYTASVVVNATAEWRFTESARPEDLATLLSVGAMGLLWIAARTGRELRREALARGVWIGIGILVLSMVWGVLTLTHRALSFSLLASPPVPMIHTGWSLVDLAVTCALGLALVLPVIGGGEALARAAHEFPPPRIDALRRTGSLTVVFALAVTTLSTFLVVLLVPAADQAMWVNDPLAGLAQHLAGPPWARTLMTLAVAAAALLVVMPAADAALRDAEKLLHRASTDGTLPSGLASLHARLEPLHAQST